MTTDVDRSSFFIALVVVDVLSGLADAISGPYVVLFLVDHAQLGPLSLSAILTARALSGIAFGTAFGAWIDRRTTIAPLLLALAGSAVGYALLGFTTDFAVLLVIAALPIAIGAAAFSQSIALVKRDFDQASPHTANRAIGVLRASWSVAWAIGPAVGALIVGVAGFRGAFLASAASAVIALMTLVLVRARPLPADATHGNRRKPANGGPAIALAFSALILFHTAMFLGSIPLPIVLISSLGGGKSDIGVAMSLCAALEIIVMGVLIWRPLQRGERAAIVVGFAAFVAYFVALTLARSVGAVFWAQILRAIAIGLVSYLGISYLQSLMPHRAGAAAALFSNSGQLGSVLAALGVGGLAQAFGYGSIFIVCAVFSAAGLVLVCLIPTGRG
ncbi:MAG: MFS transporter [Roseiarcus sp.]|uniref:MFS transporter n=1 Tax=Roseiarcus sp. TaxID=1969460 RepID=UPI003C68D2DF